MGYCYVCFVACFVVRQNVMCAECTIKLEDEYWSSQWYLNKTTNLYDMNVLPAWRKCVNGTGVYIAVVDSGVQDHADLTIERELGVGNSNLQQGANLHGTRVAGIIAAKKNANFIVGIAFGAKIVDVQISGSTSFESFDAALLTHKGNVIDVYSCSFSNFLTGLSIFPLLNDQENAFKKGTSEGRNGKGSVYVFASGNFGNEEDLLKDSCAYDGLVSNPYVIAVAGIQHNLMKVPDGEACANMMVSAFTAKPGEAYYNLVTLDVDNKTTKSFGENSAAVPMVSGAVALLLSSNPSLTYRDIMHLIVRTSRNNFTEFNENHRFFRNAAGFRVSSLFGFGLLDIGSLVENGIIWRKVPEKTICRAGINISKQLTDRLELVFPQYCTVSYLEHVEISLNLSGTYARRLRWKLVSPSKTSSEVIPGRKYDTLTYLQIVVTTVQFWGENPMGTWTVEKDNPFYGTIDGTIYNLELVIHGFECMEKCVSPKEDFTLLPVTSSDRENPINYDHTQKTNSSGYHFKASDDTVVIVVISTVILGLVIVSTSVIYFVKYKRQGNVKICAKKTNVEDERVI